MSCFLPNRDLRRLEMLMYCRLTVFGGVQGQIIVIWREKERKNHVVRKVFTSLTSPPEPSESSDQIFIRMTGDDPG